MNDEDYIVDDNKNFALFNCYFKRVVIQELFSIVDKKLFI